MAEEGFFSRWSRLKTQAREGVPQPDPVPDARSGADAGSGAWVPACAGTTARSSASAGATGAARDGAAAPTIEDAMRLDASCDFSPFVARGTDAAVRRLALRKLFADPHFHQMDGLDVYIGDYTKPDPVAPAMLATLRRAAGLLRDDEPPTGEAGEAAPGTGPAKESNEHGT